MSDLSQGHGWWQASDGKWYSPDRHPSYQLSTAQQDVTAVQTLPQAPRAPHAPLAAPPPMAAPPQVGRPVGQPQYGPPPAKKKGGKGCMIALVIFLVLMFGGVAAAFVGIRWVGNQIESGDAFGKTSCDAISTTDLNSVTGTNYEVIQLGGVTNIASVATDTRIIPDAKSCLATSEDRGGSNIRIARYEGGDAASRFQTEKTKSKGTKEDRGGGLSVESSSYYLKDAQGGDEAFCTTSDIALSSGAFVRKGNALIYVSIMDLASSPQLPDFSTTPSSLPGQTPTVKFSGDDKNCETALKVIDKIK